jgi:hypothetical protein
MALKVIGFLVIFLVGVAIAGGLAWGAAEQRYANCVEVAKALPDTRSTRDRFSDERLGTATHGNKVMAAIEKCDRVPW